MAHEGQEIVNPRTGQRMRFVELRPERLLLESFSPASREREPEHIHPKQESGAEVVSGTLTFQVDGDVRRVRAGETIVIPAGARHAFWNDGPGEAHWVGYFTPALEIASFFETLFALAQRGELDDKGMPSPMQLAVLVPEFGDEIRPTRPPWPVLRAVASTLAPIARRRGHRRRLTLPPSPAQKA
jgi:quercetin dioxygenase-like cupin family protein